ncbi:hypothetical protein LOTGIDRAFT_181114 [Lottia gigantea]|uniref:Glutamine amidotransferase type-2 domain-containing protein n=1 Tax=Lottia gigantea TaxID=225164 RepID=V4BCA1_LOTGI|nr:hypothetical protein LOTGIDRAFT_181114 [Lottia gigantea]ESP05301.1 hypothetical protein LOTGIDRAFT_181114 [Lottia gigantea]
MCGICCILGYSKQSDVKTYNEKYIYARGPDAKKSRFIQVNDSAHLQLSGYVLHLRGRFTPQPLLDENGNCLLWNGEVFDGLQVKEDENDTEIISDKLYHCKTQQDILDVFDTIQGPWAFIYWQECYKKLWFGRDKLGRRSLLWHIPQNDSDCFSISSVQIHSHKFSEIPAVGIFCMELNEKLDTENLHVELFPWKFCVWPQTQNPIDSENNIMTLDQSNVHIHVNKLDELKSGIPMLNKEIPVADASLFTLGKQTHEEYLNHLLSDNEFMKTAANQLIEVLEESVRRRVTNIPTRPSAEHQCQKLEISEAAKNEYCVHQSNIAILFSGGIDSAVITALADRCIPESEPIDLLNVAFELQPKSQPNTVKKPNQTLYNITLNSLFYRSIVKDKFNVPDRLTGHKALSELNPNRHWNFIEINVTQKELIQVRSERVRHLVYPSCTVLDDSIGCALWFAAKGHGIVGNGENKGKSFKSKAKVILCGMGADEQLAGYSRHRSRYSEGGWKGLLEEMNMEIKRISSRNLGRDDRIIGDHGKEARFPFLDEHVVTHLSSLPIHMKAQLDLPRGLGEKLLLRLSATQLGLTTTSCFPKRAIQFGSRIAKMENSKEKASEKCDRLAF